MALAFLEVQLQFASSPGLIVECIIITWREDSHKKTKQATISLR